MPRPLVAALAALVLTTSCIADPFPRAEPVAPVVDTTPSTTAATTTSTTTTTTTSTTTTTTVPTYLLTGTVSTPSGAPLAGASVTVAGAVVVTGDGGAFTLDGVPAGVITVERPAWLPVELEWDGSPGPIEVVLEPRVVRAIRASKYVVADSEALDDLFALAERTAVNALVFDTKDETGRVQYQTEVEQAHEMGAIDVHYDPAELVARAEALGLYTITRIVTFEDEVWSAARPDHTLAWIWINPLDPEAWAYPLALAEEACALGFDEVQFDYVRFPAGETAAVARRKQPTTEAQRVEAIAAFLAEARSRLHPMGCAVGADIFGIVVSSPDDQGIGQRPEQLSEVVDVISPMVYPSHYSPGWMGFADPNDHPAPVTARALDDGLPRLAPTAIMRPWLQAFWYTGAQIGAQLAETEARGLGWMLWNAGGTYAESWLPIP